jgi:plastocyanin
MKTIRSLAVCSACALLLASCASNPTSAGTEAGATSTAGQTSQQQQADTQLEVTAPVEATTSGFRETTLEADAGAGIEITFFNDDEGIPHNIQIFPGTSTTGTPLWAPPNNAMITGVAETVYEVPALAPGVYAFNCFAHPATMIGTLTVS